MSFLVCRVADKKGRMPAGHRGETGMNENEPHDGATRFLANVGIYSETAKRSEEKLKNREVNAKKV